MKRRSTNPIIERPHWQAFFIITMMVAVLLSSSLSAAEDLKTIKLSNGTQLTLNGIGKAKQLSDDYYYGALYLIQPYGALNDITYINYPKRMQIRIAYKSISARRFGQYWKEAIAINNPRNIWEKKVKSVLEFTDFFNQKLIKGDIINLDFLPDKGTFVYLNGTLLGDIRDPAFYNLLLMTWLGDRAPNPQFKKAVMRALGTDHADLAIELQKNFLLLHPTDKRKKQVASEQQKIENSVTTAKPNNEKSKTKKKSLAKEKVANKKGKTKKVSSNNKAKATKKALKTGAAPKKTIINTTGKVIEKIPAGVEIATAKSTDKTKQSGKNEQKSVTKKVPKKKKEITKVKAPDKPAKLSASERLKLFEVRSEYGKLLRSKIRQHQSYPMKKLFRIRKYRKIMERGPMKSEGVLWVKIARDGSVISSRMEKSTKVSILDNAAILMVEKADPLPPMPKSLEGNDFEFLIKVAFISPKLP